MRTIHLPLLFTLLVAGGCQKPASEPVEAGWEGEPVESEVPADPLHDPHATPPTDGDNEGNQPAIDPGCATATGTPCGADEVCDRGGCGNDTVGACAPAPTDCAPVFAPVCGCNGVTYTNDCLRVLANAARDHEGTCEGGDTCANSQGCPEGAACDAVGCGGERGLCVPIPNGCANTLEPSCGCDGTTYTNDCERLRAGVALDHPGPCASDACADGCEEGALCDREACEDASAGHCLRPPETCAGLYRPTCGCDGLLYPNECARIAAGVAKDETLACLVDGSCAAGCADDETCDRLGCGDVEVGACARKPVACALVFAPVCGCDGTTYLNDCERLLADAAWAHEGPC